MLFKMRMWSKPFNYLSHQLLKTTIPCRTFTNVSEEKNITGPIFTKPQSDYKTGKKYAIANLEKIFNIKTFAANEIFLRNKILQHINGVLMKDNYENFVKSGIKRETLLKYPILLAEPEAALKISEVKKLPFDINSMASLMILPLNKLRKIVYSELKLNKSKSRIQILSNLLDVDVETVCQFLMEKSFLKTKSLDKIEANIKLLIDYGVSLDEIKKDLWVLRYSNELIRGRLELAKKNKIDEMKTWMVRAQLDIFHTYIKRRCDNKLILGNNSLAEYISERLECNVEIAKYIILKQPVLQNKSLKKLKDLIDFLFSQGFKPFQICRVPKILVHSVETTRKRLKQLEDKGLQIDSLYMLTKSQKQFNQFYEALLKNKMKSKV